MEESLFLKYFQQIMEQFKLCSVYTAVVIFHAIYLLVWNLVYMLVVEMGHDLRENPSGTPDPL